MNLSIYYVVIIMEKKHEAGGKGQNMKTDKIHTALVR